MSARALIRVTVGIALAQVIVLSAGCEESVPPGWRLAESVQGITFYVPPQLKRDDSSQGIDSEVGVFRGPGILLTYGYGMHSGGCTIREGRTRIEGASDASITMWSDGRIDSLPYAARLCAVRSKRDRTIAVRGDSDGVDMIALCATEEKRDTALAVLRTVVLKPRRSK
jgi:hypothetical protein